MLKALKSLFDERPAVRALPEYERRHLQVAVAILLYEVTRVDMSELPDELAAAGRALVDLFGLDAGRCAELLAEGRDKAKRLTSYFGPVSAIKRDYAQEERMLLIEHLWRIAYADGKLDPHEDHYVRKIAHLLYVPNTQCMLARSRARPATHC
ncbi:MAG: TerB family tellurite resistance protein [Burkholderiales bacterium]|nr:TerB family tellurite resistance protein [Burkholderiales bacterium]